jgi:hypothetical protein
MSTNTSDFLQNKIINYLLRNSLFSPCPCYIALYTTPTTASGLETGKDVREISGSLGYKRVAASSIDQAALTTLGWGKTAAAVAGIIYPFLVSDGSATNIAQYDFPVSTGNWENITFSAIVSGSHDSTVGGSTVYFFGPIISENPIYVSTGEVVSIPVSSLSVRLSGGIYNYAADGMLNLVLNKRTFSGPGASIYAHLYHLLPTTDSDDFEYEVSAPGDYSPKYIAGTSGWTIPTPGVASGSTANSASLVFTGSATMEWGNIKAVTLETMGADFQSIPVLGANLFVSSLSGSKIMYAQDAFRFPAGWLRVYVV